MHPGNELFASVFQLKKGFTVDSGWIALVGWDFLEVRLRRTARAVTGFGSKDHCAARRTDRA
jgi:hypothetical protein